MTDYIKRQDAIDAIAEAYEDTDAEWILRELPSAQPEQCEDAVSRKAAIDGLNDAVYEHNITDFDAVATILALPPVTPKQRTGKWIDTGGNEEWYAREYRCSECGDTMLGEANFCPNCGSDMRGENDERIYRQASSN